MQREGRQLRGRKRGRQGREGGRERYTDEGRTAAGGCHGNREDCYTAHVNSVDGGKRHVDAEKASMSR